MGAIIMDGKVTSLRIRGELSQKIADIKNSRSIVRIGLAGVIVGNDPASKSYMSNQKRICMETGLDFVLYELPADTSQEDLLELIKKLNNDTDIYGIIIQVPLPSHINENLVAETIAPLKDVDCFNPYNAGKLLRGMKCLKPCTPKGIIRLIDEYKIETRGKKAVVIGRSNIVGKPAGIMLLNKDATVVFCHSKSKNLEAELKTADIVVCAVGKQGLVNGDMLKDGAVVIDAGTNLVNGKLVGDVDFDSAVNVASYITPVPGGVGSMTTTMLIENVLEAVENYG
jgi:methylenetetrahydrofolate dehydrogenase (NADP+)/methenyltetrahydrofolate cyclohydrolase